MICLNANYPSWSSGLNTKIVFREFQIWPGLFSLISKIKIKNVTLWQCKDGSIANFTNVIYVKYTSVKGQCLTHEIWDFKNDEDSSWDLLGCDAV
jgi:hypothetical protein